MSCPAAGAGTAGGLTAGSDMWSEPQQPNTASSDSSSIKSLDVPHNSPAAEGAFAAAASANKHVSWVDTHVSTDPKGPLHAVSSFPAGQHAGQTPSLWGHSTLLSVSSAPAPLAGCAGDLRDQGRASWGGVSGGVMGGAAGFNPLLGHALEAHEEVSTPLQVRGLGRVMGSSACVCCCRLSLRECSAFKAFSQNSVLLSSATQLCHLCHQSSADTYYCWWFITKCQLQLTSAVTKRFCIW